MLKGEILDKLLKLNPPAFLIVTTTLAFFAFTGLLVFKEVPEGAQDILQILIGAIVGQWVAMVQFHFGSSAGSQKKTEMLNVLTGTGDGSTTNATTEIKTVATTTNETTTPKE